MTRRGQRCLLKEIFLPALVSGIVWNCLLIWFHCWSVTSFIALVIILKQYVQAHEADPAYGQKTSPFWAKSAAAQPGFLPAVSQNSLLVMLLGECWEYPERKKELTAFSDLPARATSPAHTHPPHTSALHPHTIWTLNACLQCLNVIALATKYQTKSNVTRAFEPFFLLLLGVFSGCMKSVRSRSRRCPPNRGTTGVLTLTFNNYKSVYSINTMKPHKTCTQTHTNIRKHMLTQQTQDYMTLFSFTQPHKQCKIWTSSDVALVSYTGVHTRNTVWKC